MLPVWHSAACLIAAEDANFEKWEAFHIQQCKHMINPQYISVKKNKIIKTSPFKHKRKAENANSWSLEEILRISKP